MDLQSIDRVPYDRFDRYMSYLKNKFPSADEDEILDEAYKFVEDEVGSEYYMTIGWRDKLLKFLDNKYPKGNL